MSRAGIEGRAILLRAAALDLAQTGAIGTTTSETVDAQVTGNAAVAGQILGVDILLSAATVNLPGTGVIGDAATNRADLRATGAMTADGKCPEPHDPARRRDLRPKRGGRDRERHGNATSSTCARPGMPRSPGSCSAVRS